MSFFKKPAEEKPALPKELTDLREGITHAALPDNVASATLKELDRLEKTDPSLAEYTIGLTYLDYVLSLPWNSYTDDNLDIERAREALSRKHHGLNRAKQRALEFLAVRTLRSKRQFRALIVDDEETARANMAHVLRKEGHETVTTANGAAGVTICMALISLLTHRPARRDAAMSGEITLSGRILPVSGIREKLTAAQRAGVKTVILPEKNRTDVEGLPAHVLDGLTVLFANDVDGVIPLCLREEAS